ncbi:hypothetical protein HELRODRAFT_176710 [Helobdella robusta]|uniref:Uncharacterized protein n=1 Tax=Helobdella robusta TaxID=6412 RepID=T1FAT2_HELRO|nr:hypothetical protein HELRODRAFT_176710 [Helobdella robusta]ESN99543.1 hypothetical protein HELRODRAFT_176710 [Helobdella robusta]
MKTLVLLNCILVVVAFTTQQKPQHLPIQRQLALEQQLFQASRQQQQADSSQPHHHQQQQHLPEKEQITKKQTTKILREIKLIREKKSLPRPIWLNHTVVHRIDCQQWLAKNNQTSLMYLFGAASAVENSALHLKNYILDSKGVRGHSELLKEFEDFPVRDFLKNRSLFNDEKQGAMEWFRLNMQMLFDDMNDYFAQRLLTASEDIKEMNIQQNEKEENAVFIFLFDHLHHQTLELRCLLNHWLKKLSSQTHTHNHNYRYNLIEDKFLRRTRNERFSSNVYFPMKYKKLVEDLAVLRDVALEINWFVNEEILLGMFNNSTAKKNKRVGISYRKLNKLLNNKRSNDVVNWGMDE